MAVDDIGLTVSASEASGRQPSERSVQASDITPQRPHVSPDFQGFTWDEVKHRPTWHKDMEEWDDNNPDAYPIFDIDEGLLSGQLKRKTLLTAYMATNLDSYANRHNFGEHERKRFGEIWPLNFDENGTIYRKQPKRVMVRLSMGAEARLEELRKKARLKQEEGANVPIGIVNQYLGSLEHSLNTNNSTFFAGLHRPSKAEERIPDMNGQEKGRKRTLSQLFEELQVNYENGGKEAIVNKKQKRVERVTELERQVCLLNSQRVRDGIRIRDLTAKNTKFEKGLSAKTREVEQLTSEIARLRIQNVANAAHIRHINADTQDLSTKTREVEQLTSEIARLRMQNVANAAHIRRLNAETQRYKKALSNEAILVEQAENFIADLLEQANSDD